VERQFSCGGGPQASEKKGKEGKRGERQNLSMNAPVMEKKNQRKRLAGPPSLSSISLKRKDEPR